MSKVHLPVLPVYPTGDYTEVYDILDNGTMKGCLGAECPSSCCRIKTINSDGGTQEYRTTLFDEAEAGHQAKLDENDPQLKELGVEFIRAKVDGATVYLVNGCLQEGVGCKLERIGRKPLNCCIFPMDIPVGSNDAALKQCPESERILEENLELKAIIARVDAMLKISETRALRREMIGRVFRDLIDNQGYEAGEAGRAIQEWLEEERRKNQ